jgi:hypothetical protein
MSCPSLGNRHIQWYQADLLSGSPFKKEIAFPCESTCIAKKQFLILNRKIKKMAWVSSLHYVEYMNAC